MTERKRDAGVGGEKSKKWVGLLEKKTLDFDLCFDVAVSAQIRQICLLPELSGRSSPNAISSRYFLGAMTAKFISGGGGDENVHETRWTGGSSPDGEELRISFALLENVWRS